MQIKNIVLYKDADNVRKLDFELGKVNIISGESMTGKTILIKIVDYCLGSNECDISYGVVRQTVKWFGLTLALGVDEFIFIARPNPHYLNVNNTEKVYFVVKRDDSVPSFDSLNENENIQDLKSFLSGKLGITDCKLKNEKGSSEPIEVNISHSKFCCFQPQTTIAQNEFLFYKQNDSFRANSIKLAIPYFLGAIQEEMYSIELELNNKKRDLRALMHQKNEMEQIISNGRTQIYQLISKAKELDLLPQDVSAENDKEALSLLESLKRWTPDVVDQSQPTGAQTELKRLIEVRKELKLKLSDINDRIDSANAYKSTNSNYNDALQVQADRLRTANLFKVTQNISLDQCPLCHSKLVNSIPSIAKLNKSLKKLEENLDGLRTEVPKLNEFISNFEAQRTEIRNSLSNVECSIREIYQQEQSLQKTRDLNIEKGKVLGQIDFFLDNVNLEEDKSIDIRITQLQDDVDRLSDLLDKDLKQQRLDAILAMINTWMTSWIQDNQLDIEHDSASVSFNLSKLTLLSMIGNEVVPLSQLGSGANWVSYHILILMALHKYFVENNRPVPHFLMLDQPSQVYYPSQSSAPQDPDLVGIKKLFDFIFNHVEELKGEMQVIITDHAMLDDERFKNAIQEEWRNGVKLIPTDWYKDIDGNVLLEKEI